MRYSIFAACLLLGGCSITPNPLTYDQLSLNAEINRSELAANQEPIRRPITLYEAMARALKYNLDYKVELRNQILRRKQLRLATADMLPQVVTNAGWVRRNNFSGGSSVSLLTGITSLEPSTSSEREVKTADAVFSWHILDFGLSYVRAHQSADQVLIAREMRRKVANRIIEDVRTAFWRAVAAQNLLARMRVLAREVESALSASRNLQQSRDTSPLTALTYQRELVKIKREIQQLEDQLKDAKIQLAALMNVPPGQRFTLSTRGVSRYNLRIKQSGEAMIKTALENRPELREVAYRERINQKEAKAALLELLPGAQLYSGSYTDSNRLLFNSDWINWGAKASWNLIKVFQYPAKRDEIEAREDLLHQRALALTMAIITQVHVSRARFFHARRKFRTAQQFYDVQSRILRQVEQEAASGSVSRQTLIREKMNTLVARVRLDLAYADLQNAFANVHASLGQTIYDPDLLRDRSISEIARELRRAWRRRGDRAA